jgi:hypothetical protein
VGWVFKGGEHGKASNHRIDCFDYANDLEFCTLSSSEEQEICKSLFRRRNGQSNNVVAMVVYYHRLVPRQCSNFILI